MKNKIFEVMQRAARSLMTPFAAKEKEGKTEEAGYDEVSAFIIRGLGGSLNISHIDCCTTRLRITVNNSNIIKEKELNKSGADGVIKKGNCIQITYGFQAAKIKSNLEDYLAHSGKDFESASETNPAGKDQKQDGSGKDKEGMKENAGNENEIEENKIGENKMRTGLDTIVYSPVKGRAVELSAVGDGVFSSGMLGDGIAIEPVSGRAVAPVSGTVSMVFKTRHAIGITSDNGVEILVHIGIDTVTLNGRYYTTHVNTGDRVKAGDLLVEFDMEKIKLEGYPVITPVIITNTPDYKVIKLLKLGEINEKDELLKISK